MPDGLQTGRQAMAAGLSPPALREAAVPSTALHRPARRHAPPASGPTLRPPSGTTVQTCRSEVQLLAQLIGCALPGAQAAELAAQLIERFGSLAAVLAARSESLATALPGQEACVPILKAVHGMVTAVLREPVLDRPVLNNWSKLQDYLRACMAGEQEEVVRLLFLNSRNTLICDEEHARGTANHTPLYPRNVIRRVIETGATALIVVHNHPSGDPTPSMQDIEQTRTLAMLLDAMGVALHDHIIVARAGCTSLRQLGLLCA